MDNKTEKLYMHLKIKTKYERLEWFANPSDISRQSHRCINTVYRWIHGADIDPACWELIMLKTFGLLPMEEWEGFRVTSNGLKTLAGDLIPIHVLQDVGFYFSVYSDLQAQNEALLKKIRQLKKDRDKPGQSQG